MELRQLRYFVRTAELLNFTEAARQLFVTQSTLSQQIKALETELGVQLFERNSHSVRLTELGEAFLPSARLTLHEADNCITRLNDVQQLSTGELHIGSTHTFSPLLTDTLGDFMRAYPGVKVTVTCMPMEQLIERLKRQEVDVVLSFKPLEQDADVETHILFDTRLAVVVSDTHPLAEHRSLCLRDLERMPLALPARGMQARSSFDALVEGRDYRFDVRAEVNDITVLLNLVRSSRLVTFLSQAALVGESGLKSVDLEPAFSMEGSFHIRKGTYMKRSLREFLRRLCENKAYGMAMMDLA